MKVGGSRSGKKEVTVVAAAAVVLMLITTISLHLPTYSVTLSLPDYTCLLFALNIHSLLFLSFLSFYPSLFTSFFFLGSNILPLEGCSPGPSLPAILSSVEPHELSVPDCSQLMPTFRFHSPFAFWMQFDWSGREWQIHIPRLKPP